MKTPSQGQSAQNPTVTVTTDTLEQRVRRALRKHGQTLIKTRPNTAARRENGLYCVANQRCEILMKSVALDVMARGLGVLDDDERLERPANGFDGWLHFVARERVIEVEGKRVKYSEPLTSEFTSADAARAAFTAAGMEGNDIVLISYNARGKAGQEGDDAKP